MNKHRCLGVVTLVLTAFALASGGARLSATSADQHELVLRIDPALHQRFGLSYPVTYILHYGDEGPGLRAWVRYDSVSAWIPLTEHHAGEFFNGIDAVRFDPDTRTAYVSATLSAASDDLHLRVTTDGGTPVAITYGGVAQYYDDRAGAVVISIDDWKQYTDTTFVRMISILRSYNLPFTAGVITGDWSDTTYAHIQAELDAGGMEAAPHTRDHERWPFADVEYQVEGARLDLFEHLTMPAQYRRGSTQYIYSFIVPYGETSAEIETVVTHAGFLVDRVVGAQTGSYTAWDTTTGRFPYDGTTREMGSPWGSIDAAELNASFDERQAQGLIYHLLMHPYSLITSGEAYEPFFADHLGHISNRTNIWYTTFGHLYVYRLLGDTAVGHTVWPETPPVVTVDPSSQIIVDSTAATFSCVASGSPPLTFQWQKDGIDIPGAINSTFSIAMVTMADSASTYRCIVMNAHGADTSASATLTVISTSAGSGIVSDDFNATALNTSLWQITDPLHDTGITMTGGGTDDADLAITVPAGVTHDLWIDGITAPRIMQSAVNADFSVEAKFDAAMTSPSEIQGLVVEQDSLNFIRFDLVYDENRLEAFAATFTDGTPTEQVSLEVPLQAPYYLRLRRTGDTWSGYYSGDGVSWTPATTFTHEITVRKVGAWVGNAGSSAPAFTGLIDYIYNTYSPFIGEDGPDVRVPPTITADPTGLMRYEGETAAFTFSATGTFPFAYRWQRNGVDMPGGTGADLSITSVARADSGVGFRCIVSNMVGKDTSATAVLHVVRLDTAKVVRQPADTLVSAGTPAQFTVEATGTLPLTYQWLKNGAVIADAIDSVYRVEVAAHVDSGAAFRCIVTNRGGRDTSAAALLHVRPMLTPPTGVRIALHVFLEGAMSGDSMSTALQGDGVLPLAHPFAALGWLTDGTDSVGSMPAGIVDWVLVEFRDGVADSTVRLRRAALLHADGSVTDPDGVSPVSCPALPGGSYFVVVRHRNHLPVMSATALALDSVTTTFDFRSASSQYYGGDAAALSGGKYGMVAGNTDHNRGVGATDLARIRLAIAPGMWYGDADVDLSGTITTTDIAIARGNIGRVTRVP